MEYVNDNLIIDKFSLAFPKDRLDPKQNILKLDLSNKIYKLYDLDELDKDGEYRQYFLYLNEIDVQNNKLSLLRLKGFNYLERIFANSNLISLVELNLANLKKLELTSNLLDRVPILNNLPNLEELRLNKNSLTSVHYDEFKPVRATLNTLDLGYNKINFMKVQDFFNFIEPFGKNLIKLRALNIDKNIFSSSKIYANEYQHVIIYYCESLNVLNGRTIDEKEKEESKQIKFLKLKIEENEKEFGNVQSLDAYTNIKDVGNKLSLSSINKGMEIYRTLSRMGNANFYELKEYIDKYIIDSKTGDLKLTKEEEDVEDVEFEDFLEHCNYIIENNPALEKVIYDIIANFTVIKNGKFSDKCLTFFKHHIASSTKVKDIEEVVQQTIIEFIKMSKEEYIPPSIIRGLEEFSTDSKLSKLTDLLLSKIIKIIITFKDLRLVGARVEDDSLAYREIFASCISFLSKATRERLTTEKILKLKEIEAFLNSISQHLQQLLLHGEESISMELIIIDIMNGILSIMTSFSKYFEIPVNPEDKKIIQYLTFLKNKIENLLTQKLELYQKTLSKSTVDNSSKKTDDKRIQLAQRQLLGNMIITCGALIRLVDVKSNLKLSSTSMTFILLRIASFPQFNDPVIIASICDFLCLIFENQFIARNEDDTFASIVNKLFSMKYIIQFLIYEKPKYRTACSIVEALGQSSMNMKVAVIFSNLTSGVMHKMFISILKFITFFERNSRKPLSSVQQICQQISKDLNDLDRDNTLTKCLVIPSDEVRKAAVECLYYVNVNELDENEIRSLYSQIQNVNLVAGDIEIIVATIFIILTKTFRHFKKDPKNCFKIENNKEVFSIAFDILLKNQERITIEDDETEQKVILSQALCTFLINCSTFCHDNDIIKKVYRDKKVTYKIHRILEFEEIRLSEQYNVPIEIEKTKSGFSISNLHECLKNDHPLYPYSYVFLRVLIHIADILANAPYNIYNFDENKEFEDVMKEIEENIKFREKQRIEREGLSFNNIEEEIKLIKKNANSSDFIMLHSDEAKEEQKRFVEIFQTLLIFITGKSSYSRIAEFDKIWEDKIDPRFNTLSYNLGVNTIQEKVNLNEISKNYKNESLSEKIKRLLREETIVSNKLHKELLSQYDYIHHDLSKPVFYGSKEDNKVLRVKADETANNPHLRGLIIAAFLRTIYNILEYPLERSIKEDLIFLIRKGNNIKDISMLVDSGILTEFNLASKYLEVMRIILLNSKVKSIDPTNISEQNEYLNQIGVISFMLRKMINVYKDIFNIENEDHGIFLANLPKCAAIIINELHSLQYPSEQLREEIMSSMISNEMIDFFIKTVKSYMNRESTQMIMAKNDDTLTEMIYTISYILGEYMSKCKESSYNILESFTRSYIFEKVKMRKTYLREIVETCKISDFKTKIENEFDLRIYVITLCNITNYNLKTDTWAFLLATTNGLKFLNLPPNSCFDIELPEWQITNYEPDQDLKIKYEDIIDIYSFEFQNRMIIKTRKISIGVFIIRTHIIDRIIETIQMNNNNFQFYKRVKIFSDTNEDINSNFVFHCIIKDFQSVYNMFKTIVLKEKEIIPNAKVVVIKDKKFEIYSELVDKWKTSDIEYIIKSNQKDLAKFYKYITEYDLKNLKSVIFTKTDLIIIEFKNKERLEVKLLDDSSYLKLRKALRNVVSAENFNIFMEDICGVL
jgi:hypothetical protein